MWRTQQRCLPAFVADFLLEQYINRQSQGMFRPRLNVMQAKPDTLSEDDFAHGSPHECRMFFIECVGERRHGTSRQFGADVYCYNIFWRDMHME